jgi:hypothetical protein
MGKDSEGDGSPEHLLAETENHREKVQSSQLVSGLRFEPGTFGICENSNATCGMRQAENCYFSGRCVQSPFR